MYMDIMMVDGYRSVVTKTKSLDTTRPVTLVTVREVNDDVAVSQLCTMHIVRGQEGVHQWS